MNYNYSVDLKEYLTDILEKNDEAYYGNISNDQRDIIIEYLFHDMGTLEKFEYLMDSDAHENLIINISKHLIGDPKADFRNTMDDFRKEMRPLFEDKINLVINERRGEMSNNNYYKSHKGELDE